MAMARDEYDYLLKVVLLGDLGVGKSSLLLRFADNTFTESFITTIGVDFKTKTVDIEGKRIKLQIWDTAGQERFRNIEEIIFRGTHIYLLCFDLTGPESFGHVRRWFSEVGRYGQDNAVKVLVGLKTDKTNLEAKRQVDYDIAKDFADILNIPYLECSAKTNTNVEKVFFEAASLGISRFKKELKKEAEKRNIRETTKLGKTLLKVLNHNYTLLNVDINPSDLLDRGEQLAVEQLLVRNRGLVDGAAADSKGNKKEDKRPAAVIEKLASLISNSENKREVASEVKNNPLAFDWSQLAAAPEPLIIDEIPDVPPEAKKPEPIPDAAVPQRQDADVMSPHLERKAEQKRAPLSPIPSSEAEQAQYAVCITKLKAQIQQPPPAPAEQWQSLQPSLRELEEHLFRLDAAGEPWAWAPTDPAPAPSISQLEPLALAHPPAPPAAPRGHMVFLPPPSAQQSGSVASSDAATADVFKKSF